MMNGRRWIVATLTAVLLSTAAPRAQDVDARAVTWKAVMTRVQAQDFMGAQDILSDAMDKGDHRFRLYLMRGYVRYRLGREDALEDLQEAANRHPEMAYIYAVEALTLELSHRFDLDGRARAVYMMDRAIERDPNNALYYGLRGRLKMGVNQFKEAMADFEKALHLDPNNVTVLKLRFHAYREWGGHDADAERDLAAVKRLDPEGKTPDPELPLPPLPGP